MEAAFLKDVPCEISGFVGRGVQETLRKGVPKGSKNGPRKRHEQVTFWGLFGIIFWFLGRLLGLSWGTLLLSCRLLAPEAHKGRPKGGQERPKRRPREPKRGPRGAQVRPRESQKCSGEPRRGPREPLTVPREPKTGRESSKESPRQRLNHVCKEGGLGGSFPPALYKQGQDNLALRRASLFIVLFASVFAILHVFALCTASLCFAALIFAVRLMVLCVVLASLLP